LSGIAILIKKFVQNQTRVMSLSLAKEYEITFHAATDAGYMADFCRDLKTGFQSILSVCLKGTAVWTRNYPCRCSYGMHLENEKADIAEQNDQ
jgi:hypothetical protein